MAEKKELLLNGLSCASCAAKIEDEVKNIQGVKNASVDFISSKLTIEAASEVALKDISVKAVKIAKRIEPDVNVVEPGDKGIDGSQHFEVLSRITVYKIVAGTVLFLSAVFFTFPFWTELLLFIISYLLFGGDVVLKAFRNLIRGQVFDENFLMSIATLGAFAIGEYPEAVAVMLFYQVGEVFQDIAVNRSRRSIKALLDIRPDYANLKAGEDEKKVSPGEVNVGDVIVVKPGEKVPLDGKVIEGRSMIDVSALTGESLPVEIEVGSEILSGAINKSGLLMVEVTKEFGQSTVSKILDLVENASSKKAPTENFITKFARYYTPAVVFIAATLAVIPPLIIGGATFSEWINRALVFLVVSCPCALVVSIPLGFFGGIGGASKNGILVKGGNYLEALNNIDTAVFDKTGTLTKGVFKVTGVNPVEGFSKNKILKYAAYAESFSNHPIAVSILSASKTKVDKKQIENYTELPGYGIKVSAEGKEILVGNAKLMDKESIEKTGEEEVGTIVYVAVDHKYAGYIVISDEIKDDSAKAIKALKEMGIKRTVMLTGDNKVTGAKITRELGLDGVYSELLPDQKVEIFEELYKSRLTKGNILYVGDGINDAPVIARADVGIAMGALGSDAAIEAADVVLLTDEPSKLVSAIKIAKRTRSIVWQNIVFALTVKAAVLILGAGGIATMWEAVFADVGVALIAIVNSMRAMKESK